MKYSGSLANAKLPGGGIPDVPITVDAQLRINQMFPCVSACGLREKSIAGVATRKWIHLGFLLKCIIMLAYTGQPSSISRWAPLEKLWTQGILPWVDPLEMIMKLANSERLEQVFIRHAFRFGMGHNETLHDRPVLLDAHQAYRESGGSMKALIHSLVTSDAFLYRTVDDGN